MVPDPFPTESGIGQRSTKVDAEIRNVQKEEFDRSIFLPSFIVNGKNAMSSSYNPKSIYCLVIQISIVCGALVIANTLRMTLTPITRGFFSCDLSIRYPYHESTYLYLPMLIVCLLQTLLIITITETLYYFRLDRSYVRYRYDVFSCCGYTVHPVVTRIIQFMLLLLFGFALNKMIVSILKNSFGQLRPNFIDACQPNGMNITDRDCKVNEFIFEYECMNPSATKEFIQDTHLSFPSGHTSTAFYFAVFAVIYLYFRLSKHIPDGRLIILFIQWSFLVLATKIGLSRISDHKHHASDVMFGALFGSAIAASVLLVHEQFLSGIGRRTSYVESPSTKEEVPSPTEPIRHEMSSF